jgi:hypothetical protein
MTELATDSLAPGGAFPMPRASPQPRREVRQPRREVRLTNKDLYVDYALSWVHSFGRLRRRLDRLTEIQNALLDLASAVICLRILGPLQGEQS